VRGRGELFPKGAFKFKGKFNIMLNCHLLKIFEKESCWGPYANEKLK
jgi:hypothetical protein